MFRPFLLGLSAATLAAPVSAGIVSVSSPSGVYEVGGPLMSGSSAYTGNSDADASTWVNLPTELEGIDYVITNSGNATTDPLTVTVTLDEPGTVYVFHSDLSVDPEELQNLAADVNQLDRLTQLRRQAIAELERTDAKFVEHLPLGD